jgi:hypothetical protein
VDREIAPAAWGQDISLVHGIGQEFPSNNRQMKRKSFFSQALAPASGWAFFL